MFVIEKYPGYESVNDLISEEDGPLPKVTICPHQDIAVLPYSSGTTGPSKGVMLTHYNLVANICQTRYVVHVLCLQRGWMVVPDYFGSKSFL